MKFDFDLVLSAVPTCKEAILTSEKQRGCGSDTVLRYSKTAACMSFNLGKHQVLIIFFC